MIGSSATAEHRGGSINLIKSMQFTEKTGTDPHIRPLLSARLVVDKQ
jgi:hypothetical protein